MENEVFGKLPYNPDEDKRSRVEKLQQFLSELPERAKAAYKGAENKLKVHENVLEDKIATSNNPWEKMQAQRELSIFRDPSQTIMPGIVSPSMGKAIAKEFASEAPTLKSALEKLVKRNENIGVRQSPSDMVQDINELRPMLQKQGVDVAAIPEVSHKDILDRYASSIGAQKGDSASPAIQALKKEKKEFSSTSAPVDERKARVLELLNQYMK